MSDTKEARINLIMAMASTQNTDKKGSYRAEEHGPLERSLIAAVTGALSYGEETRAITLDRVKAEMDRDSKLSALREALTNTSYELRLPEDLEEFDRYRDRLSVQKEVGHPNLVERGGVTGASRSPSRSLRHAGKSGTNRLLARHLQGLSINKGSVQRMKYQGPLPGSTPAEALGTARVPLSHDSRGLLHDQSKDMARRG